MVIVLVMKAYVRVAAVICVVKCMLCGGGGGGGHHGVIN